MTATPPTLATAFRELERALTRRRWAALGRVVQVELAAIAALIAAFCAWQVRIPLDGMARNAGPGAAARVVALQLATLVVLAAVAVAVRTAGLLGPGARSGPGAAWLALPIPPRVLERHLRWDARRIAGWFRSRAPSCWRWWRPRTAAPPWASRWRAACSRPRRPGRAPRGSTRSSARSR